MSDLLARLQAALGDAYRIENELGGGGMSRVFLATEASLHRAVVIKLLPPEFASEVSEARFKQEIELAAHLQHPNILPVLTAGARDDLLFYVMPFVSGESLRHRLTREGKLPVADAVRILHEMADALAYAHAEGVIHRDVKPENILLEGAHAVLTDFGVARALVEARSGGRLTETGMSVGTPAYMSPEQAAGERHLDARADVYALAVVGYEMLAGVPPFAGPTAQAVIAAHLAATPRPLVDVRAETPPAVSDAIMRALAKDPGARLRTAAEFRDALGGTYARAGPRRLSKRARIAAGITAVAVAAGAALLLFRPKAPPALDPNLLAVAPFDVLAPNLELWREGLVDVLSRNLDGAGPLRTVSPTVVIRRWSGRADPASATELGRRTGARLVVFGGIEGAGPDSVRMSATVFDVGSGSALAEIQLPGASARMDRLGDSLTVAVLRELGRTRPIGAVRLTSLGSTSLPAVKAFLRGEQFYRRGVYDSALAEYQRAVALDSSFTLALARIPLALWWRPSDTSWVAYMLRAGRHNRGLAPRESLLVTIDSLWGAVWGKIPALSLIRRLTGTIDEGTRRYPDDPELWYHRGEVGHHWGGWSIPQITAQQALEAFERSIALDSAFAPAYEHVSELALRLRGPAAARRYIRGYLALAPSPAEAAGLRILEKLLAPDSARSPEVARLLDTLSGDALWRAWYQVKGWTDSGETAVRLARSLAAARHGFRDVDSSQAGLPLARTLAYRGHLREAYRSLGLTGEGFGWKNAFTELALLGAVPRDSAAATFGRWLRANNSDWGLAWWGATGDTGSIHELARRADSLGHFSKPDERGFWRYVAAATQPYLALTRHDTAEALRRFATLPDSLCRGCYLERLTRLRLLSLRGKDQEVALLPDEELHEPDLITPSEALWAVERGRVNERLGKREKAVRAFSFVADVWRKADPELQPYVEEAKAALKRLGGEPRQ